MTAKKYLQIHCSAVSGQKGFSILEVLVTLLVVAVLASSAGTLISKSASYTAINSQNRDTVSNYNKFLYRKLVVNKPENIKVLSEKNIAITDSYSVILKNVSYETESGEIELEYYE